MTITQLLAQCVATFLLLCFVCRPGISSAQSMWGSQGNRPAQVVSAGYYLMDFAYDGGGDPSVRYDYTEPAFGIVYTNPFLTLGVIYGPPAGPDSARVDLLDATLATMGSLNLLRGLVSARYRLYVPLGFFSNYRRVRRDLSGGRSDEFDVTTLAVSGGLGARARVSKKADLHVRATPGAGLATRSFGDATGLAYFLDANAQVTFAPIAERFGIAIGYGFRYQGWNMRLSRALRASLPEDYYDYQGRQHGFRVGLAF